MAFEYTNKNNISLNFIIKYMLIFDFNNRFNYF